MLASPQRFSLFSRRFVMVVIFGSHFFSPHLLAGEAGKKDIHAIVPGFERFFAAGKADAALGGQMLLGELNCTSCHKPDPKQEAYLSKKLATHLDGVAARVKVGYLRKFLRDPQSVKPGSTMPHMFAGVPEKDRQQRVEELVHFLTATGSLQHQRPEKKLAIIGRDLYQRVGCVACHGSCDGAGNAEKLLPTSVALGDLKAKYTIPGLASFLENPHQVRPSGRMPGLLNNKEAREVAHYLLQGISSQAAPANMKFAYYEGSWDRLPDFGKLKPGYTGESNGFDLSLARRPNDFAMTFAGYLRLAVDGEYRFHLTSDDGSRLVLDDKHVVGNDGVHAPTTVTGAIRLKAGMHKLFAAVFNAGGGVELGVDIEGSGLGRQPISSMVFLTPQGNPVIKIKPPEKTDDVITINPSLVEKGRESFASLGCAGCHQLHSGNKVIASGLTSPALSQLKPDAGCLAPAPARATPSFFLSMAQRSALSAAIKSLAKEGKSLTPKEIISRTLTTFNCYACHERDKVGGVEEGLNAFFTTAQPEMGEEGRVPPPLDGVGGKLTAAWMKKIFANGAQERPYMHTRMPKYGEQNVGQLVGAFAAVDTVPPVGKVTFKEKPTKVKAAARHMVGSLALGCIKCHTFAGQKAEGIQAIDMTSMAQRLRRDWFHLYLFEPQKIRPLTRMPSAWPMGQTLLPNILEGDTTKQIEAIWLYLSDANPALPLGLGKHFIPLIPDKEAIIYRNFIEGSGARAIGVGYPEKVNLAFDANEMRLAMIWQGAFIDASRHWTDRGVGYQPPLGDNILKFPTGSPFAVLAKDAEPWPNKPAKEQGYKFRGYRLTPDQRPTFMYSMGDLSIEDFSNAVASKSSVTIRRKLTVTAAQPVEKLWFRAAVGNKVEAVGKGWYQINGEWRIRIETSSEPTIREVGGQKELLVPVNFGNDKKATIVQEFSW